jgi:hypothetical protein
VRSVPQCTTGRVIVLDFKSSGEKLFFWIQEPKTDKDAEYVQKLNEYMSNPSAAAAAAQGASGYRA